MFTLFTESIENSTPAAGQFILGLEADGAEFRYPLGAALATLFSDSSATSVAVPRLNQLTSTTSDPTVSDYGAGEWGVHKNSSTGDLFLAYNDGGAMNNLSLSGGDDWGSQVVETDATLSGNGTAGSPLSVVNSGGGLTNWEENGTTLRPVVAGYDLGETSQRAGTFYGQTLDLSGNVLAKGSLSEFGEDGVTKGALLLNESTAGRQVRVEAGDRHVAFIPNGALGIGRPLVASNVNGYGFCVVSGGFLGFSANTTNAGSPDALFRRVAANHIGMHNGANPQSFSIYNLEDGANYERGGMYWDTNVLVIGTEAAGTGSGRDVHIKNLPTSNPGPGILWNNAGTPAIGT
jgi:hypothetical protein